jgi:tRNA pseudouridine38-40 synthase
VSQFEIERRGALLRVRIAANAFLHHMVRNIVGALVEVGVSRQAPDWVAELLATRDRSRAAPTFAASGLYLSGVQYDASFGLPEPVDAMPLPG